ncbi:MAG TPA: MMPL family transporter [Arenicellales bacterium]|nr:MMPL family transporter [Arenicellales bacterium]
MTHDSDKHTPSAKAVRVSGLFSRWYWLILLLAVASAYYSFNLARHLDLDTDLVALMPDGVPSVENLERVIQKTGGYSNAMVIVDSPDPDAAIRFLDDLRERILELDYISSAEYAEDTSFFHRNQLLYVEEEDLEEIHRRLAARIEYEKKHINFSVDDTSVSINIRGAEGAPPSLDFSDIEEKYKSGDDKDKASEQKIFRNEAGNVTILVVLPEGSTTSISYARRVTEDLESLVREVGPASYHPEMTAAVGGRVANRVAEFDVVISDLKSSAFWSIGGILLVIILFYRRLMAVLYIGAPLAVAFLWTFALTQIVLGGLNLITVFLVLILFGLGIDFGIHNLQRYDEVRSKGGDLHRALATIIFKTGHASLLAALTTAAGFYALMLTDFRAFSEFGFIAGTGVVLSLASMYVVFPALLVLAERTRVYRLPLGARARGAAKEGRRSLTAPVLVIGGLLTVLGVSSAFTIEFEKDFGKLDTTIPRMSVLKDKIREVFPLRNDKAVVYVESLEDVSAVVEEVRRIRESRSPEDATIDKVKSIYDVVPESETQRRRLEVIEQIHDRMVEAVQLLEDFGGKEGSEDARRKEEIEELLKYAGIQELKPGELPTAIQRVYTGVEDSQGYLVYIYNAKGTSELDEAQAFVDDIREINVNGKTYYPATEAMVFVDMLNLMRSDAKRAVAVVLGAVFVVLLLAYRSLRSAFTVMIPVLIGMSWMLGIMAFFGIRLNVINMVVLPTVLGIGVDNGIHIFQRFREEGFSHIREVVMTTGGAAFLTTITTLLGFAGTLAAQNGGLQSLGLAASIGLSACLVSSLTVFPALLSWFGNRLGRKTL